MNFNQYQQLYSEVWQVFLSRFGLDHEQSKDLAKSIKQVFEIELLANLLDYLQLKIGQEQFAQIRKNSSPYEMIKIITQKLDRKEIEQMMLSTLEDLGTELVKSVKQV